MPDPAHMIYQYTSSPVASKTQSTALQTVSGTLTGTQMNWIYIVLVVIVVVIILYVLIRYFKKKKRR